MSVNFSSSVDIAVSGLRAQAMRMSVIGNNIANANTMQNGDEGAFRRKLVVLSTDPEGINGVEIKEVTDDTKTDLKRIYDPGRPEADADGYVTMPNVDIPLEMMNMVTASRAYEASAATLKRFQSNVETTLELLR